MSNRVAVATTSQLAADAAAEVAEAGGNAVDCAIAAAMCSINSEPGVCALAGGAYATIWPANESPVTIDGNVAVPGAGLAAGFRANAEQIYMQYGGGIETVIGPGSIAIPGTLAALDCASSRYGHLPWGDLLRPTIDAVRRGFPLSAACHHYLEYSGNVIYERSPDGHQALHNDDGSLKAAGTNIVVPHLADSLAAIADEGSRLFYEGEIGESVAEFVQENGGLLTREDLASYQPIERDSLTVECDQWTVATNPPPAIGGAILSSMLLAFRGDAKGEWNQNSLQQLVDVQEAALSYRKLRLDVVDDVSSPVAELIELARSGDLLSKWSSGSTVHTSVVDETGLACSITASSGYGSGEMPPGTGLWLNNCLGELELNNQGLDAGPPGRRLPSNMAPGAARCRGHVVAIGSPGADRITTALHQFLVNYLQFGFDLEGAIAHPRLHLALDGENTKLAIEPELDIGDLRFPIVRYPEIGMYFGGVVAASYDEKAGLKAAADPRREGGTYTSPQ